MRIVVDTNVLYQALRNQTGASYYILQQIRAYQLELALSIPRRSSQAAELKKPLQCRAFP
tara:strand:+ start:243 stop:422 length:180 start_codon:yes stop_codon:yes gene_type:complete